MRVQVRDLNQQLFAQNVHIFPSTWMEREERCGLVMVSLTPWATRGQHLVYISFSHQSCRSFHTQTQKHTQVLYCNSITSQSWQKSFSLYFTVIKKRSEKKLLCIFLQNETTRQRKIKIPCVMSNFLPKHWGQDKLIEKTGAHELWGNMVSTSHQRPQRSPGSATDHTDNPPSPQSDPGMNSEHNRTALGMLGFTSNIASLCQYQELRWCINGLRSKIRGCHKLTLMEAVSGYWLSRWQMFAWFVAAVIQVAFNSEAGCICIQRWNYTTFMSSEIIKVLETDLNLEQKVFFNYDELHGEKVKHQHIIKTWLLWVRLSCMADWGN